MKTKDYTHLIIVGEAEAKMIQGLLWQQKIPSELHPSSMADVLAGRAVHGNLPYEVRVPEELLEEARQILNLEKPISIPKEKHGYLYWVTLIGWIFISLIVISIIIRLLFSFFLSEI